MKIVAEVVKAVCQAETTCYQSRDIVHLVTLDVKNSFNLTNWNVARRIAADLLCAQVYVSHDKGPP